MTGESMMTDDEAQSPAEKTVASTWAEQARWSETANQLRAKLTWWRNGAAVAGVVGAFLATLAAAVGASDDPWPGIAPALSVLSIAILAVVPYVSKARASQERIREWVRARSASEALKEEIYRYLLGAPPYKPGDSPSALIKGREAILKQVEDLNLQAASVTPVQGNRPHSLTMDQYVDQRVTDQVEHFYLPKGRENARKAQRFHNAEFYLGLFAVLLAALAGAAQTTDWEWLESLGSWVAVVTTASAAVTAHLTAARYDRQAMTYLATARELTDLRDIWQSEPDAERLRPERVAKFVDDSEHAISKENDAWMAKWNSSDDKPKDE
jgi:hypothetical protein